MLKVSLMQNMRQVLRRHCHHRRRDGPRWSTIGRRDRMLAWSPAFRRSYERSARELAPDVVDYDGLLLDGWMIVEDKSRH